MAVIICRYGIPQEASGILGVVGPTRMEYPVVMGGVKFLASFLGDMVTGIHRGLLNDLATLTAASRELYM